MATGVGRDLCTECENGMTVEDQIKTDLQSVSIRKSL